MTIEVIRDPGSAAPIGPYSQGIKAGGFVFVAGEKGIDPPRERLSRAVSRPRHGRPWKNVKAS